MNQFGKEEELFNGPFQNPYLYIFSPSNYHKTFTLTEFVSKNPLNVKSLILSNNLNEIIEKGNSLAKQRSIFFINNKIYTPY